MIDEPARAQVVQYEETFHGPIPDADQLGKYEMVLPGAADRIIAMAESQLELRHKRADAVHEAMAQQGQLEHDQMDHNAAKDKRGQYIAATVAGMVSVCSLVGMTLTPWATIGFVVPLAQIAVAVVPFGKSSD